MAYQISLEDFYDSLNFNKFIFLKFKEFEKTL